MISGLDNAFTTLLGDALPELFGGDHDARRRRAGRAEAPVGLGTVGGALRLDPQSADAEAGAPRPDDQRDALPFDPEAPAGPYNLSRPPYPGPRRVALLTADGSRQSLRPDEVRVDPLDPRRFDLEPRPGRELSDVVTVEVLYAVTAVFAKLGAFETWTLELSAAGDDADDLLARAEALVLAVLTLRRPQLIDTAAADHSGGEYAARVDVKGLRFVESTAPEAGRRHLDFEAELEVKLSRALADDEGLPIERIRTPGGEIDPERPVDIRVDLDA